MLWKCVGSEVVLSPAHSTALPLQSRSLGWNALGLWSCRSQGDERPLVESLVCQCAILCHLYPFVLQGAERKERLESILAHIQQHQGEM